MLTTACALARPLYVALLCRLLLAGVVGVLPVARLGDLATLLGVMIKAWGQQVGGTHVCQYQREGAALLAIGLIWL